MKESKFHAKAQSSLAYRTCLRSNFLKVLRVNFVSIAGLPEDPITMTISQKLSGSSPLTPDALQLITYDLQLTSDVSRLTKEAARTRIRETPPKPHHSPLTTHEFCDPS